MNPAELIENIRKEHIYKQSEYNSIKQLNIDITDEIESTFKLMCNIKNQRYVCDKLHVNHSNDPINLMTELNSIEKFEYVEGHRKFSSNEQSLSHMLQYLRNNPKAVTYLLYHAEKNCPNFLDLLSKIIVSTVYSHCFLDQDRLSLIEMMEELIEIYLNFCNDLRRQIYNKNSSFWNIYRYFCDELSELKTFYKLVLNQPVMLVLSEDNLFLDIDSNRAAMRFHSDERRKHFGDENLPEYQVNLERYKKWTLQKLKYFVSYFIKSLKDNIYAFPQSLVLLMNRLYIKLIEHLEFERIQTIFTDMIFFFLLCPAIQNPDLFGITDLHINQIAHYNLMQCAQILQILALSKWEKVNQSYKEICDLFSNDCLSFVIDHILYIAKSLSIPRSIESIKLPYFLISDIELKFLIEYIKLFLEQNNEQSDNPLSVHFKKIPEIVLSFEYESKENSLKTDRGLKKSQHIDPTQNLNEFSNKNIRQMLSNNSNRFSTLKIFSISKQIFQIKNTDFNEQFFGIKNEDKLLEKITNKQLILENNFNQILKEIDHIINVEVNNIQIKNDKEVIGMSLSISNDSPKLLNNKFDDSSHLIDSEIFQISNQPQDFFPTVINESNSEMQSLGVLTLNFEDINDDVAKLSSSSHNASPEPTPSVEIEPNDLFQTTSNLSNTKAKISKKVITGLKNIKEKVKNISLKDNNNKSQELSTAGDSFDMLDNVFYSKNDSTLTTITSSSLDIETIRAETNEILGKYRSKNETIQQIIDLNLTDSSLIDFQDSVDASSKPPDSFNLFSIDQIHHDIKLKLCKLMCLINLSRIYESYRFLNLFSRKDFIMFLKIILSKSRHVETISTSVLIMDILRLIQEISQEDFVNLFKQLEVDMKIRYFYIVYLLKSRQYLLQKLEHIKSLEFSLQKEKESNNFIIISLLVRLILDKHSEYINSLISKFRDQSTLTDEKASLVNALSNGLLEKLQILTEEQIQLAKKIIEQHLFNKIYLYAFYPNGDIDQMRDQILHQQISTLAESITHHSDSLRIAPKYFNTSPWPSAQAELLLWSAYKAPHDKVQCVHRCCTHIISLLGTGNSDPSADDLLPVLIFVIIKSNPRAILSTIQYINTFYSNEMCGEESYYWTLFCSAVEFAKTLFQQT